jgi:hypothetical protein
MPVSEGMDRLMTLVNFILIMMGKAKGDPKDVEVLRAGILSFLQKVDEVSFEEALSELDEATQTENSKPGDGVKVILDWLNLLETSNNKELQKIPPIFRKVITTHPVKDARVKILMSYARAESDEDRTLRFKTVTLPEWITRTVGVKFKKAIEYIAEKIEKSGPAIKADIKSSMNNLRTKMQARRDKINAGTGGN